MLQSVKTVRSINAIDSFNGNIFTKKDYNNVRNGGYSIEKLVKTRDVLFIGKEKVCDITYTRYMRKGRKDDVIVTQETLDKKGKTFQEYLNWWYGWTKNDEYIEEKKIENYYTEIVTIPIYRNLYVINPKGNTPYRRDYKHIVENKEAYKAYHETEYKIAVRRYNEFMDMYNSL